MRRSWREFLAVIPLPMLALAASYGVYSYVRIFVPEWVAIAQASAFEMVYVGLSVVQVQQTQRNRAVMISIGAVVTSVVYNTLAGLFYRQPSLLVDTSIVFDTILALLHGAPLAWVAFLLADLLLHREQPREQASIELSLDCDCEQPIINQLEVIIPQSIPQLTHSQDDQVLISDDPIALLRADDTLSINEAARRTHQPYTSVRRKAKELGIR
jgi:hypothetical protein